MHRYLALIWNPNDHISASVVESVLPSFPGASESWETAYKHSGLHVIHHVTPHGPEDIHSLADTQGIIIGTLFRRAQHDSVSPHVNSLDSSEIQKILNSGGRHIIERYWGSYVAFVHDSRSRSWSILRDPTASLACYHAKWRNIQLFFSDIEDFKRCVPMSLSVNLRHIASNLFHGEQLSRDTCLAEVEDVPGGEWTTICAGHERRAVIWRPEDFCIETPIEDEHLAAIELRSTVLNTVHTLASRYPAVMLRLSGGLDSSIVAACLSKMENPPPVTCLNFYITSDNIESAQMPHLSGLRAQDAAKVRRSIGGADERDFARSVANNCGFPLLERERTLNSFKIERLWNAPLGPRPSNYVLMLDADQVEMEVAIQSETSVCFTGEAGDTVFYNTRQPLGAMDYAYLHPLGSQLFHHIAAAATLSGESIAGVSAKVLRHGFLRVQLPSLMDPLKQPHLMSDQVVRSVLTDHLDHTWSVRSPNLCPGKRNHVLGVALSVPSYQHVFHAERIATAVHPLAAQPVVETCLRIPTYVLLADGVSRGLARRAFEDLLPSQIVRRTVKGYAVPFWQRVVRHNNQFIRDCLLDGILVREGLLDRTKLERYLTEDQPFLTVQAGQILVYLEYEAWMSQWYSQ